MAQAHRSMGIAAYFGGKSAVNALAYFSYASLPFRHVQRFVPSLCSWRGYIDVLGATMCALDGFDPYGGDRLTMWW